VGTVIPATLSKQAEESHYVTTSYGLVKSVEAIDEKERFQFFKRYDDLCDLGKNE
jgi:hypothetical protein